VAVVDDGVGGGDARRGRVRSRINERRLVDLTAREREVLALVAEGRSNRSVAERLGISVKTVEAQVATIFSKLQLEADPDDNRRVLAVLAYLEGRYPPVG